MSHRGILLGGASADFLPHVGSWRSFCLIFSPSFLTSIFHRIFLDFGRVLGGFWEPKWLPNRWKNRSKKEAPKISNFCYFFACFWLDLQCLESLKIVLPSEARAKFLQNRRLAFLTNICYFGLSKNDEKSSPK